MFTYLGFDCFVFCLCFYDLVLLFVCYFCDLAFLLLLVFFCFVLQEQHVISQYSTYHFWWTKKFEGYISADWNPRVPNQPSSKCKKIHRKQFVKLARCERVLTTWAVFHFSWIYTFFATPRSLRIWATHSQRETSCNPAPPAQLCWSSSRSFTHTCNTTSWNWTVTKLI